MASPGQSPGGPAPPGGPPLQPGEPQVGPQVGALVSETVAKTFGETVAKPVSETVTGGTVDGTLAGTVSGTDGKPASAATHRLRPRPSNQILLLADSDLVQLTRTLAQNSARGILCTQGLLPEQVVALRAGLSRPRSVRRPLHPLLAPETLIHSRQVGDYRGKDFAVAEIGDWAGGFGLAPRFLAAIEQALDEMLMNALFAAPRNASGGPRYGHLPASERIALVAPPDEQVTVRYGADARRVVIAVSDRFGALRAATVLAYLLRCAESQRLRKSPIEDKISGSGVGLFLITTSASELIFRLRRGRLTELVFTLYRERSRPLRALVFDDDAARPPLTTP